MSCHRWSVRERTSGDHVWINDVLSRHWGGAHNVINGAEIDLTTMPALIAGDRSGIAIFRESPKPELLLLQAIVASSGVGTALLDALATFLQLRGRSTLSVTTTNDNVAALAFYQRYGFRFKELRLNKVEEARAIKPSIPAIAQNGIPIRDEIELILNLDRY
jgi:GNAT superfamily N-acetyltransferase